MVECGLGQECKRRGLGDGNVRRTCCNLFNALLQPIREWPLQQFVSCLLSYPIRRNLAFEGSPSRVPGRIFGTIGAASPPTSTTRSAQPPSSYPLLYTRPSSSIFKLQAPPLFAFYLLIQPVPMQVSPEQLSKLEHTLLSQTEPLHNRFRALFTLKAVGGSEAIRIVAEGASAV